MGWRLSRAISGRRSLDGARHASTKSGPQCNCAACGPETGRIAPQHFSKTHLRGKEIPHIRLADRIIRPFVRTWVDAMSWYGIDSSFRDPPDWLIIRWVHRNYGTHDWS